jgi:putative protease
LNGWRRDVVLKLIEIRTKNYPRIFVEHKKTDHPYSQKELDFSFNVANSLARSFYERHGAKILESAFEMQNNISGKKVMTTKHCLKYFMGICPKNIETPQKSNKSLYLVYAGKKYSLNFDCKNCQMEIWNN